MARYLCFCQESSTSYRRSVLSFGMTMVLLTLSATTSLAEVSAAQRSALMALYNSTDGGNWTDSTNWLGAVGSECTWFGVECDSTGARVISLRLPNNQLSGPIPPEFAYLRSLHRLALNGNQLVGAIPPVLGDFLHLDYLSLGGNQLTGPIPSGFSRLTDLHFLDLGRNRLTGRIPSGLDGLRDLYFLGLRVNRLQGPIPAELGALSNLRTLVADGNLLTGRVPREFRDLRNLETLRLDSNQLSGTIPRELGSLESLRILSLTDNRLSGPIPIALESLQNLERLKLRDNQLQDSIPPGLGRLPNLVELDLSHNRFSGPIPPGLANLSNLESLFLSHNRLVGPLPAGLGELALLQELDVESNSLVGQLPDSLVNLDSLQLAQLDFNGLYTSNEELRNLLLAADAGDWEGTQTVVPTNVAAVANGPLSALLSWTPIRFTEHSGGYRVLLGTTSGGPYFKLDTTDDKAILSFEVSGLSSDTEYFFAVQTVTEPHPDNTNRVESELSREVTVKTLLVESSLPVGTVIDWYCAQNCTIPDGFMVADGSQVTDPRSPMSGQTVPDLRNLFIRGATSMSAIGETGGSDQHSHIWGGGTTTESPGHAHIWSTFDGGEWTTFSDVYPTQEQRIIKWDNGIHNDGSGYYPLAIRRDTSPPPWHYSTEKDGGHRHGITRRPTMDASGLPRYVGLLKLICVR